MKVNVQSKKGLKTTLSIIVDKSEIKKKLDSRLIELQKEIDLKGFRKGKVPPTVIKNQFGKAIYGEVIDKVLKESTTKVIQEKKLKISGQPKIDLKTFGEGKDLNFELQLDLLPEIKLQPLEKYKATEYLIKVDKSELDQRLNSLTNEYKSFDDKKAGMKSELGDQVSFNYKATVDNKEFEGGKGEGVTLELGKELFLKGFDNQLVGLKKNDKKKVISTLPPNHPKTELANKKAVFECEIINIKFPKKDKLDNDFAKKLGAKDLSDLSQKVKNQISGQYTSALNSITKKEILEQLEKNHKIEIPQNLIDNEVKSIPKKPNVSNDDIVKSAEKRIKLGLVLNEYGEKNQIKVTEDELKSEIQKQVKSMPGQEKLVFEYYQKNPSATQHLQSTIYEEKIINSIKSKINLSKKELTVKEAEKLITNFNTDNKINASPQSKSKEVKPKKIKKISKK